MASPTMCVLLANTALPVTGRFPVRALTTSTGLPSNSVDRIFQDSRGRVRISTIYGGDVLACWDPGRDRLVRRKVASQSYSLPHGPPATFREDASVALWVGFS